MRRNVRAIAFYKQDRGVMFPLVYKPKGYWENPGGGIKPEEDEFSALIREVKEETGRDVIRILPNTKILIKFSSHKGFISQVSYAAEVDPVPKSTVLKPKEIVEVADFDYVEASEALKKYPNYRDVFIKTCREGFKEIFC